LLNAITAYELGIPQPFTVNAAKRSSEWIFRPFLHWFTPSKEPFQIAAK